MQLSLYSIPNATFIEDVIVGAGLGRGEILGRSDTNLEGDVLGRIDGCLEGLVEEMGVGPGLESALMLG